MLVHNLCSVDDVHCLLLCLRHMLYILTKVKTRFLPTGTAQQSEVDVFSGICLFVIVCPHDNLRDVGPSKLVVRYILQKSSPSSKINVTRHKKKQKTAA